MKRERTVAARAAAALLGIALTTGCVTPASNDQGVASESATPWTASDVVALRNGLWFDGRRFVSPRVVYVVNGRLSLRPDGRPVTRTVDLERGFVIPPLGDAHTHFFDGLWAFDEQNAQYLREGVFYALSTTAPASGVLAVRDRFSTPESVDVVSAQAGFTGPLSHPAEIYNAIARRIYDWREQHRQWEALRSGADAADDAYFVIRSAADLEEKWRLVEERRPDVIKVFLRSSERYRPEGPPNLADGGIDPALLPLIVQRAHGMGLRVFVANSTVADFRTSLSAGADAVTHLPCYQASDGEDGPYADVVPPTDETCLLSAEDAARARRAGLVSTLIASEWTSSGDGAPNRRWEMQNVSRLLTAGAPLAIGSNAYGETPVPGLIGAQKHGWYSAGQLLRWATMDTPRAIFPQRRVGCLTDGCEASLLVLGSNPLVDLDALRAIKLRIKDGLLLPEAEIGDP